MSEQEFYIDFKQDIVARSGAEENFTRSVFLDYMCSLMEQEGLFSGYDLTEHKTTSGRKQLAVDAWSYDSDRSCLYLVISDYRTSEELETLTNTEIKNQFRRLRNFVQTAFEDSFKGTLEESDPVVQLAWLINEQHRQKNISKIILILISNANLSGKVAELPDDKVGEYPTAYDVWDLGRVFRIEVSGKSREMIDISFEDLPDGGIPCLPAHTGFDDIKSYLLVMPGVVLARLYEEHGERLLEQNVRTFLQFRGKVNKGIRNTIVNEPHMFFSYNNGLTATAESVITNNDDNLITRVRNFQIVNGGQTTASIFNAQKKDKANLSAVYVQVKLSVISSDTLEEIVPKISEYANTQNKVSAADFFSNHPFHRRIEEFSRRLWAPAAEGSIEQTHWFYERARGQYANKQTNMTYAEKRKFLIQNPRRQMFTKTDLAKFILTFDDAPHIVSLGAQKAFSGSSVAKGLVQRIAEKWDKHNQEFNELWFKHAIAKAILFRSVDALVYKSSWYQGYKANIVTYTLAKLAHMVKGIGLSINFIDIWDKQKVPSGLMSQCEMIAEEVNEVILNPPEGETSNSSEWAKKLKCWELIRELPIILSDQARHLLVSIQEVRNIEHDARRIQDIQNGIHDQTYVVEKGQKHWQKLREWNRPHNILSPMELSILNLACSIPYKIPSEKQSKVLINAEIRAIQEGFYSD